MVAVVRCRLSSPRAFAAPLLVPVSRGLPGVGEGREAAAIVPLVPVTLGTALRRADKQRECSWHRNARASRARARRALLLGVASSGQRAAIANHHGSAIPATAVRYTPFVPAMALSQNSGSQWQPSPGASQALALAT